MPVNKYSIDDLIYLMKRLRDPVTGCPWDLKQDYQSIASHTLEEVYEVIDAIERDDLEHLSEELGDLLFPLCSSEEDDSYILGDDDTSSIGSDEDDDMDELGYVDASDACVDSSNDSRLDFPEMIFSASELEELKMKEKALLLR